MDRAALHLTDQEGHQREIDVTKSVFTIGRDTKSELKLGDSTVSKKHARIIRSQHGWKITDLGSANGTFVNGERLAALDTRPLANGTSIRIGKTYLVFQAARPEQTPVEEAPALPPSAAVAVAADGDDDLFAEMLALLATDPPGPDAPPADKAFAPARPRVPFDHAALFDSLGDGEADAAPAESLPDAASPDEPQPRRAPFDHVALFENLSAPELPNLLTPDDTTPDDVPNDRSPRRTVSSRAALFDSLGDDEPADASADAAPPDAPQPRRTIGSRAALFDQLGGDEPADTSQHAAPAENLQDAAPPEAPQPRRTISSRAALFDQLGGDEAEQPNALSAAEAVQPGAARANRPSAARRTVSDALAALAEPVSTTRRAVTWQIQATHTSGETQLYELTDPFTIGRADYNQLILDDATVSLRHAQLVAGDDSWYLLDLDSASGTLVDGARVPSHTRQTLHDGAVFQLGDHTFTLQRRVWRLEIMHRSGQRQVVELHCTPFRIGAAASNDLELQDSSVESVHAELQYDDGVWRIFDRDSAGGTYVDDVSLLPDYGTPLSDGSRIVIGGTRLIVGYGASVATTARQRPLVSLPQPTPAPEPVAEAPVIDVEPASEPEPAPAPVRAVPQRWSWRRWLWRLAASRGYLRMPYALRMPLRRMQRVQHMLRLPSVRFELVNEPLFSRARRAVVDAPAQVAVAALPDVALEPRAPVAPLPDVLHILLSTPILHVDPGAATALVVTVTNRSAVVDRVQIVVAGLPDAWVTTTPRELALFPGDRSEAHILIRPPRGPVSLAGEHHFSVVAHSAEHVQHHTSAAACLVISAYTEFHLDLRPQQQSGWQRLIYRLDVVNSGNQQQIFQFQARDDEDVMLFTFVPPEPVVPPGGTARVRVFVQRTKRQWIGAAKLHMFTINGGPKNNQTPPAPLIGRMLQQPIFSKITLIMIALLLLLLLAPFVWPLFATTPPPEPTATAEPTLAPTLAPVVAIVPTLAPPPVVPEPVIEPTAVPEPPPEPTVAVSPTAALPPATPAPTVPPPTATPTTDYVVRAGDSVTLAGTSTPRMSFLVWFDDRVISGGIVRPDGRFAVTIMFGDETPGVHTLVVRERGGLRVLLERTCFIPDPAE